MARLIEDVLDCWRGGERLLERLSPVDPAHEAIREAVCELKAIYTQLADPDGNGTALEGLEARLRAVRLLIEQSEARLQTTRPG
jgi:hypothetical protein